MQLARALAFLLVGLRQDEGEGGFNPAGLFSQVVTWLQWAWAAVLILLILGALIYLGAYALRGQNPQFWSQVDGWGKQLLGVMAVAWIVIWAAVTGLGGDVSTIMSPPTDFTLSGEEGE
jgi:hypothetical protein